MTAVRRVLTETGAIIILFLYGSPSVFGLETEQWIAEILSVDHVAEFARELQGRGYLVVFYPKMLLRVSFFPSTKWSHLSLFSSTSSFLLILLLLLLHLFLTISSLRFHRLRHITNILSLSNRPVLACSWRRTFEGVCGSRTGCFISPKYRRSRSLFSSRTSSVSISIASAMARNLFSVSVGGVGLSLQTQSSIFKVKSGNILCVGWFL